MTGLRQMLPSKTTYDSVYGLPGNTKLESGISMSRATVGMNPAYLKRLFIGELGHSMKLSRVHHALASRVLHVVVMSAQEQVIRPDAARIIPTWAVVANVKPIRNGTVCERPCHAMGKQGSVASAAKANAAISIRIFGTGPKPTTIGLGTTRHHEPEPICKRFSLANSSTFWRAEFPPPKHDLGRLEKEEIAALLTGERKACKVSRHLEHSYVQGDTSRARDNVRRLKCYSTKLSPCLLRNADELSSGGPSGG